MHDLGAGPARPPRKKCRVSGLAPVCGPDGAQLAVHAPEAAAMTLELFHPDGSPLRSCPLDPARDREGGIWRIRVPDAGPGTQYGWRAAGPAGPRHAFDPDALLLDPYAPLVAGAERWGERPSGGRVLRSQLAELDFDWGDDRHPGIALADTVIHETHVRAFTRHPSSGVEHPGTYLGLIEALPRLADLGVTAIQLMPVAEFDETANPRSNPLTGERLLNVWGYDPLSFFAVKTAYSAAGTAQGALDEFRTLVRACHAAGLEVLVDVVFNHTGEGSRGQRAISWKGLDRPGYYLVDAHGRDRDTTGCGHTVACQSPVMSDLIVEALVHWANVLRVDGFRFDIATALTRDTEGREMADPPLTRRIAEEPRLAHCKLIAEAWDIAAYQVGRFPHHGRWAELNGRFRDDTRRFWKGTGHVGPLATRLTGSSDLYAPARRPGHSTNFLTSHDGFTLADLVSYERKHNIANGEDNRDGTDDHMSWNGGHEGPTDDPHIRQVRLRQVRNLALTQLVSQGSLLWLYGDDRLRTQHGNNNPWCQDGPGYWLDWSESPDRAAFRRFVRGLVHLRRRMPSLRRREWFDRTERGPGSVMWHGERALHMDWSDASRRLVMQLVGIEGESDLLLIVNGAGDTGRFELPSPDVGRGWKRLADTGLEPPHDWTDPDDAEALEGLTHYEAVPLSAALLMGA